MPRLIHLLLACFLLLCVSSIISLPWPFTVNQDSPYGRIYAIDSNTSSPAKDSSVNMTFYIQPLKEDFTFSPKFDAKSNISALDYLGTWGPNYPLSKPCKLGTVCTVWCVYKSGTFVANYTAVVNITKQFPYISSRNNVSIYSFACQCKTQRLKQKIRLRTIFSNRMIVCKLIQKG